MVGSGGCLIGANSAAARNKLHVKNGMPEGIVRAVDCGSWIKLEGGARVHWVSR
jgi:hypothetical protein